MRFFLSWLCLLLLTAPGFATSSERIAYSKLTDGHWQIWVVGADGISSVQLTQDSSDKRHPCWSSDGKFIVFNDSNGHLHRLELADRTVSPLRAIPAAAEADLSINGRLVHQCVRQMPGYLAEVWTSKLDGSDRRVLTQLPLRQLAPSWSPDGRQIVVAEYDRREEDVYSLAVLEADGDGHERILSGAHRFSTPSWSPAGDKIAYARDYRGNNDIWVYDLESGKSTQLTFHPGLDSQPDFSPDGDSIVFVSRRDGALQLWKIGCSGNDEPRLLSVAGELCRDPAWFSGGELKLVSGPQINGDVEQRKTIEPAQGVLASVKFSIDSDAAVIQSVLDESGASVVEIPLGNLPKGEHRVAWDGRTASGDFARPGVYLLALTAINETGTTTWNPAMFEGGEPASINDLVLESELRSVKFQLPSPSRIRVRFGLNDGPMVGTPIDFEALGAGTQSVSFEGIMAPGWGDFWEHPDRHVWVTAYRLPSNAVIVKAGEGLVDRPRLRLPAVSGNVDVLTHAEHAPSLCKDPEVSARLSGVKVFDDEGLPVVSEVVDLVIDVPDPANRAQFESARFEVMIFLDDYFLMEDEDSVLPFHYRFDVSRFPSGVHSFLVNVSGYSHHTGIRFLTFRIDR